VAWLALPNSDLIMLHEWGESKGKRKRAGKTLKNGGELGAEVIQSGWGSSVEVIEIFHYSQWLFTGQVWEL
jgi:hypothetical protein